MKKRFLITLVIFFSFMMVYAYAAPRAPPPAPDFGDSGTNDTEDNDTAVDPFVDTSGDGPNDDPPLIPDDSSERNEPLPSCFDGKQNQGELDIDCGGPCPKCSVLPPGVVDTAHDDLPVQPLIDTEDDPPYEELPEPDDRSEEYESERIEGDKPSGVSFFLVGGLVLLLVVLGGVTFFLIHRHKNGGTGMNIPSAIETPAGMSDSAHSLLPFMSYWLGQGRDFSTVKQYLTAKGWPPEYVDEAYAYLRKGSSC